MEIEVAPTLEEVVAFGSAVGNELRAAGLRIATAESCTGGLIGHVLTEIAGSSDYFAGGAIVYSNDAKEAVLGVQKETMISHGAVSYETAGEMARAAQHLYDADIAVSVTGIAGPGGGTASKPSGLVHIHLSSRDGVERGERFVWQADRSGNKLLSAQAALEMVLDYVRARS